MVKKIFLLCHTICCLNCSNAQDIKQQLDNYLSKANTFNGTVLVMYKDSVLLHKGYGYKNATEKSINDSNTIYRIGSLTKPFTAAIILHMEQLGLLKLSDPISKYLIDYPNGSSITIEQLLTHKSGIKDYLQVEAVQKLPDNAPPISMEKLIDYFKNEPLIIPKKNQFNYSNSNYILLAAIIEKITGQKFEQVAHEIIFTPLHMQHSGFDFKNLQSTDKSTGYSNAFKQQAVTDFDSTYAPGCGSMYATVGDLYKWYKGLLSNAVINAHSRENAFQPRNWLYGYGWFSYTSYGRKCISHPGGVPGFIADMKFYPDDNLCIILLSNSGVGKADANKIAAMVFQKQVEKSPL
ncbi:MAG: serine hydrolase domain-containing protein [Chitinophagaceae bacterium]